MDDGGAMAVEDLGSTNGTWVNDERLAEPRTLADGDELRLGQSCFTVELPHRPAATQLDTGAAIAAPTIGDRAPAEPCVRVVSGPSEGLEIAIGAEFLIGRSYGEPGALGGDRLLSRRHARIARGAGGSFFIEDTGSTNGTTLNGRPLRGAHPLRDEDEIKVGSSTMVAEHMPGRPLTPELDERPVRAALGAPHEQAAAFEPQGAASARFSSGHVTAVFAVVFAAAALVAVAAVLLAAPLGSSACATGFICHPPPKALPLRVLTTFTGSLGWRTEYDPQLATPITADASGNQLVLHETAKADQEILHLTPGNARLGIWIRAYPSSQFSAVAAMQSMANAVETHLVGATTAPSADQMFGVPVLGFHTASGEVLDGNALTPQGPGAPLKLAVLAATSGSVTIVAAVVYEIQRGTSQGTNPDLPFDQFADTVLETVRFPSDGST